MAIFDKLKTAYDKVASSENIMRTFRKHQHPLLLTAAEKPPDTIEITLSDGQGHRVRNLVAAIFMLTVWLYR